MIKVQELERLTEFEIKYLKTFEERLETIYPHEKKVFGLIKKLNEFIKSLEGKLEKEIVEKIEEIKKEILLKFGILNEESEEDTLTRAERRKKKDLLDIQNFSINIYNALSGEEAVKEKKGAAYNKIRRFLRRLKKDIEKEERGITLNEHIFFILEHMHNLKEGLKHAVKYEAELLDLIEKQVKSREIDDLENSLMRLKGINKQIKGILRTEKNEVYRPFMNIALKEIGGAEQFSKLRERTTITLEDIKKDLMTMTDPDEIRAYIGAIPKELVEEDALPHLENYKTRAREISERQKREVAFDPLTHLFTRKIMDEELNSMTERKLIFSFILLDIDHFKSVNDSFGHQVGDRVLKTIARLIKSHARASDFVCRYGGEEIAIILPRTSKDEATAIAKRIRKTIEEHDFYLPDKRPVTISGGVSSNENNLEAKKPEIIDEADGNLYKAKKTGRNKIIY